MKRVGGWSPTGSSPLARGPHGIKPKFLLSFGLIPARAGTTQRYSGGCWPYWAHPRSRGDHLGSGKTVASLQGSSPLARGPHTEESVSEYARGLIPARAGTTCDASYWDSGFWAHPRSRGDHVPAVRFKLTGPGSSPLARGPQSTNERGTSERGLIPARAGTTLGV